MVISVKIQIKYSFCVDDQAVAGTDSDYNCVKQCFNWVIKELKPAAQTELLMPFSHAQFKPTTAFPQLPMILAVHH